MNTISLNQFQVNIHGNTMAVITFLRREWLMLPGILLYLSLHISEDLLRRDDATWNSPNINFCSRALGALICALNSFTWPARKCYLFFGTISAIISIIIVTEYSETIIIQAMWFVCGFSIEFLSIVFVCHIADNVTKNYRGSIATYIPIIIYGFFGLYQIPYAFDLIPAINIALCISSMVLTYCFTSDPVTYLLEYNEKTKAEEIFQNSNKGSATPTDLKSEIDEMANALQEENSKGLRCYLDVISNGNWRPVAIISALHILKAIAFRMANTIFVQYPMDEIYNYQIIMSILPLVLSKLVIDRIGRKPLFWISGFGFMIALYVRMKFPDESNFFGIPNVKIFIFSLAFTSLYLGIMPLSYVYLCESFSLTKRNISMAYVTMINLCISWILSEYPIADDSLWLTAVAILSLLLIVGIILPETKCLSLSQCRNRFKKYRIDVQPYPSAPSLTA